MGLDEMQNLLLKVRRDLESLLGEERTSFLAEEVQALSDAVNRIDHVVYSLARRTD